MRIFSPSSPTAPDAVRTGGWRGLPDRLLVALLAGVLSAVPGRAATLLRLGDDELCAGAPAIVLGRATRVEPVMTRGGRTVETRVRFEVIETLKGGELPDVLEIRAPGGDLPPGPTRAGGRPVPPLSTRVPGAPRFEPGEKSVLFLWPGPEGEGRVMALSRGKFEVRTDGRTGEEVVTQDLTGIEEIEVHPVASSPSVPSSPAPPTALPPAAARRRLLVPDGRGRVQLDRFLDRVRAAVRAPRSR